MVTLRGGLRRSLRRRVTQDPVFGAAQSRTDAEGFADE
jgi:hypothetical protein